MTKSILNISTSVTSSTTNDWHILAKPLDICLNMFEQNIVFLYKPRTQDMATEVRVEDIRVPISAFRERVRHGRMGYRGV